MSLAGEDSVAWEAFDCEIGHLSVVEIMLAKGFYS